ncbi:MAG: hypothetical protein R3F11_02425 [Verrucomicrobiales bacterium]
MDAIKRFFRYEPYGGNWLELLLGRLCFAAMLLFSGDFLFGLLHSNALFDKYTYDSMPVPNGLGHWIDFTWVYTHHQGLKIGLWIACACYVAGVFTVPAVGYLLVLAVALGTLRNSQGHVHHGTQLMALTLLALFAGYLIAAIRNLSARRWRPFASVKDHRFAFMCGLQGIAAYYFVAGVAKIEARGLFRWIGELQNMGIYVDRNGHQQFLAGGTAEAYERSQAIAAWINAHPILTMMVFVPGLLVELGAPLALLNRRVAFAAGVVVLGLHVIVGYVMQLTFPMNELVILIFLINVPFLASWPILKIGRIAGIGRDS